MSGSEKSAKKKGRKPVKATKKPKAALFARSTARRLALRIGAAVAIGGGAVGLFAWGCSGWDPRAPFERNAPAVEQALRDLDAGRFGSAEEALTNYLNTGTCVDGGIGVPPTIHAKPNGGFDLGLTLFSLAERFGHRFGEEDQNDGGQAEELLAARRGAEIDCALLLVKAIAGDVKVPLELRARAHYLAGNLEFLRAKYEDAVTEYGLALALVPGRFEDAGGDGIGRDAAWNRAIALRRIEEQKDAGNDGEDGNDGEGGSDGSDGSDAGPDSGDASNDGGDSGNGDSGNGDGGDSDDAGNDGGSDGGQDGGDKDADAPKPQDQSQKQDKPQPPPQQDERMLDKFEEAPTYQEQEAKARANTVRRGKQMEDK